MYKHLLLLISFFVVSNSLSAQFNQSKKENKKTQKIRNKNFLKIYPDSASKALCFSLQGGYQIPTGNLANRFANSKSVGVAIYLKSKSNFCYGITGDYYFGKTIKENNLFKNIKTVDGNIINPDGGYSEIKLYERGYFIGPTFGYISKIFSKNKNSGLSFWLSAGFFEHRIKILGDNVYQLSSDYKVGYDRLTNGFAIQPAIFYYNMSRNHLVNYRIGVEFLAGFTQGQRNINFDTGLSGRDKRFDGLLGIKAAWYIPKYLYSGVREITY
ncbi:MAG: hypothetical protein RL708_276 [Bacteroidota bacterium]|jgi:hypothetical protein